MTDEQRIKIIEFRRQGFGYKSIAIALRLLRESVRAFCKRKGLDGYGSQIAKRVESEAVYYTSHCRNCGKPIKQDVHHGRPRVYCSKECKMDWERNNPRKYQHMCYYCGKKFESSNRNAVFCSHKCYVGHRFYRNEDLERIVRLLKKGKPIKNSPGWIRDLILGLEEREGGI